MIRRVRAPVHDPAAEGAPTAEGLDPSAVGWVAEEALTVALYCALAAHGVTEALLLAVDHSGGSDSTGSLCGNLHGYHGRPQRWVAATEGRAAITVPADGFAAECVRI